MKRLCVFLLLLMSSVCWSANYFGDDPNCVGLYAFEGVDWTDDTSGNGNDLAIGIATEPNDAIYHEGAQSLLHTSALYRLYRTDADLSADFPGKNGTSNNVWSATCWVNFNDISANYHGLVTKWHSTSNLRSWGVWLWNDSGTRRFAITIGYSGGSLTEIIFLSDLAIGAGKWYHVGATFNDSDNSYRIRVYDENADTVYQATGNSSNDMNIEDAGFAVSGTGTNDYGSLSYMDEVVVFKDVLTADEIDEIRTGTYGNPPSSSGSSWWWRRRHN